ncbi:transmembrane transporter [Candidatus Kinetoplastibacterium blastocrithidii TCC012E]|uniref:Transmembrane transporter n=1 Tax=Candidatus Kinetoplastidibacterium blastocrithidiae TCC012E TaxID=1208922 RepID=M1LVP3_9PROT|nr:MFS transporter [Candidatus Kinetoplastibacterium blastocrithidii]AFZ83897.1 major facilitator protein [Candidatus Kinetoplastibacterium blastocrithidii (ex Strigomonas culicis)]AGF49622.1 transmembrane transporter [Candidatus Kinetoplastibacterium blastocrithidii TCC012E]
MNFSPPNGTLCNNSVRSRDWKIIFLISFIHALSHFFQLVLPSLYIALGLEFSLDFAKLGLLASIFYVISGVGQVISGIAVDKYGPFKVLLFGIIAFFISSVTISYSFGYFSLLCSAILGGIGNSVFHPAGYLVINKLVSTDRLGYAFSLHGLSGSIGWACAPIFITTVIFVTNWRIAALSVAILFLMSLLFVIRSKDYLHIDAFSYKNNSNDGELKNKDYMGSIINMFSHFAMWGAFIFFISTSFATSSIQQYTIPILVKLYGSSEIFAGSMLSTYMVSSAMGIFIGGLLISAMRFKEGNILISLIISGVTLFVISIGLVPVTYITLAFIIAGFCFGIAIPSRDMLVRKIASKHSTSLVYGVVYSGMDIGSACGPILFGFMMDTGLYRLPWIVAGLMLLVSVYIAGWLDKRSKQ